MSNVKATISERGNGLPDVGDYVVDLESGEVYRVVELVGRIQIGENGSGNYIHAVLTHADWSDVDEDNEPQCSAVIEATGKTP